MGLASKEALRRTEPAAPASRFLSSCSAAEPLNRKIAENLHPPGCFMSRHPWRGCGGAGGPVTPPEQPGGAMLGLLCRTPGALGSVHLHSDTPAAQITGALRPWLGCKGFSLTTGSLIMRPRDVFALDPCLAPSK